MIPLIVIKAFRVTKAHFSERDDLEALTHGYVASTPVLPCTLSITWDAGECDGRLIPSHIPAVMATCSNLLCIFYTVGMGSVGNSRVYKLAYWHSGGGETAAGSLPACALPASGGPACRPAACAPHAGQGGRGCGMDLGASPLPRSPRLAPAAWQGALALRCTAFLQAIGPARPPPRVAPHGAPALCPTFVAMSYDGLIRAHSGRRPAVRQNTAPYPAPGRPVRARFSEGDPT